MTHNSVSSGQPVGTRGRWLLFVWSLFLLGGFALAGGMEPDPRGYGTHERLGLPPCTFRTLFDLPCPSCGMTTSFSCMTRGRFAEAAQANIGGALLAVVCAAQIPWCWLSASRGRLWGISRPGPWLLSIALGVSLVSALNWIRQLIG
jgi:Protein of unknown function (DUF2752)